MKIIAITQARVGSSRLPGKVLKDLGGQTLLGLHLERASASQWIHKLVVATTTEPDAERIVAIAREKNAGVYQGSLHDVLDRYYQAALAFGAGYVVRITSDCPLLDAQLIDAVIQFALDQDVDYASNTLEPSFPDGQDVEVFRFSALERAWKEAVLPSEREHVTAYIWKNSTFFNGSLFTSASFKSPVDYGQVRLTVDEPSDYDTVSALVRALGTGAGWEAYATYYQAQAGAMRNHAIHRNEGYQKSLNTDNSI
jgi:spore coat polysaccharide biosynthesis protein SpsF